MMWPKLSQELTTLINHHGHTTRKRWAQRFVHVCAPVASSLMQRLIRVSRSPECYCKYVGLSAWVSECMYVMCMYVCMYEPRRDPTPFTRSCASRMAHPLRQTSIIFRQVEILLAHRQSVINSTSCQSTLSSTSPWYTADRIDFLFSGHLLMLLVSSAQLPALSQISLGSLPKNRALPEAAAQATTTAAAADQAADHCKAFPRPLLAGFWLAAILTRSERESNEVVSWQALW